MKMAQMLPLLVYTLTLKFPQNKVISSAPGKKANRDNFRDFPRANLGLVIGPYFFPNRDRNSQI